MNYVKTCSQLVVLPGTEETEPEKVRVSVPSERRSVELPI
jgi:hypothetical protein